MNAETIKYLLIGLCIGLFCALLTYIFMAIKRARAKRKADSEIARYKQMLSDRMELEANGMEKLKSECESLRTANENLRVSLQTLSQKAGKRELVRLNVYQTAIDRLTINSPGFGPAWQAALKESQEEFKNTFTGTIPFLRKFIPGKTDAQAIEFDEEN